MHNELSIVFYVSKHEDIANYALYILIPYMGKLWQGEILANGLIWTNWRVKYWRVSCMYSYNWSQKTNWWIKNWWMTFYLPFFSPKIFPMYGTSMYMIVDSFKYMYGLWVHPWGIHIHPSRWYFHWRCNNTPQKTKGVL